MMKRIFSAMALITVCAFAYASPSDGLVVTESQHGVAETAEKAVAAIESRGLKLVARVDHAAGAQSVGLELRPTVLLLFGNPKVGTPLMHCSPMVAIDLPQKLLIWEDQSGTTRVGYNAPAWLDARHGLGDCAKVLDKVETALAGIAAAATK